MTQRSLHLAKDLALPIDFATKTAAILAQRRKGKTYTASVIAEEMVAAKQPFVGHDTKAAREIPKDVWPAARRRMTALDAAKSTLELAAIPGNQFQPIKETKDGRYDGFCKMRINQIYRLIFMFKDGDAYVVGIENYHGRTTS